MLAENLNAQRGAQFDKQAVHALTKGQVLFLFFRLQGCRCPLFTRAFPGEEPDEGQHQRAQYGEHQAGVKEGNGVVFPKVSQQDTRQEGGQNRRHLSHTNTRA